MIDILLATCNSAPFLRRQIDSIIAQSESDWQLIIRDGGSQDETLEIISEYCREYPGKIIFLESKPSSALENFTELLKHSTGKFVMYADHDDVWFPEKIEVTLKHLRQMEQLHGADTPLCVFTDAAVTDGNKNILCRSNLRNQHLDPVKGLSPARLLVQNVPSGNTMLFNCHLRDLISPIPAGAVMHDHYTALAAAFLGKISCLEKPTLYYCQHGGNVLGSAEYSFAGMVKKFRKGRRAVQERFFANCRQAEAFLAQNEDKLPEKTILMLRDFSRFRELNWFSRRWLIIRYGLWKTGILRNLGMLLII